MTAYGSHMTSLESLARDLVRIGSVNPMGRGLEGPTVGEARLGDYIERFFTKIGVPCERQHVAAGRDNIIARISWPGSGPMVLLEAHQDTVPDDGMSVPAFDGEIRDGKLYGRGACDVKGGLGPSWRSWNGWLRSGREGRPQ